MKEAVRVSRNHPVLIDSYLQNAVEVDVDAVCDGEEVLIGGIMEHIEQAGIDLGDSACVIPTQSLSPAVVGYRAGLYPEDCDGPRRCGACQSPACRQRFHSLRA